MTDPPVPWWWPALGTAVPSIALAAWQLIKWLGERKDTKEGRRETAEERHEASLAREREQVAAANASIIATLRIELERERSARERAEAERDLEWNRGRRIYDYARHLVHEARNARQIAESLARLGGQETLTWSTPIDLPPFDPPKEIP
jgi:hypothetical protein